MQQPIFISPETQAHPRWKEAFAELKLVSQPPPQVIGQIWLSTECVDWQQILSGLVEQGSKVVVITLLPEVKEAARALELGARGYAHAWSAPAQLQQIASVVDEGGLWVGADLMSRLIKLSTHMPHSEPAEDRTMLLLTLTAREKEVALAVCDGKSNKEIARDMDITDRTVKAHLAAIFQKLGVRDRLHLALKLAASTNDKLPL